MAKILVEVQQPPATGDLAARVPVAPQDFDRRAAEIADSLTEIAERFGDRLEGALDSPSGRRWGLGEVELGFQLAVSAEAGVIIAKAKTEGTFTAKLTWQRNEG
jgi:hypothetical protein